MYASANGVKSHMPSHQKTHSGQTILTYLKPRYLGRMLCLTALAASLSMPAFAEVLISQKGRKFTPGTINVKAGEIVKIINDDKVPHNVFFTGGDGEKIDLGLQKPGEETTFSFDAPGDYTVRCSIHLMMRLKVTVE